MQVDYKIITDVESFVHHTVGWGNEIVADVETKDPTLLGLALCDLKEHKPIYIPVNTWNKSKQIWEQPTDKELINFLKEWLNEKHLVGHNFTYDRHFINTHWGIQSVWSACTRILWHLSSAPSGPRPYGLKDAQKELLSWETTNEKELDDNVKSYGGRLKNGDHYLADLHILAKYASLDVISTAQVYNLLSKFLDNNEYHWMLRMMMDYAVLLDNNTRLGIRVDRQGLEKAHARLIRTKDAASRRVLKLLEKPIRDMENDWADRKMSGYKREYNRVRYASHPEEWQRFNFNSDKDKRELFYDKLKYPVIYKTEKGQPQVNADAIKQMNGEWKEAYLKYEKANTLSSSFSLPYLSSSLSTGKLHPGFNICGTVSYRLSGFKPYLLNAPFDEKAIMRHLQVSDGYIGVHADLSAIEPTITAHYSEDPSLLKVFRDGLGDIYLDLALELFADDRELQEGYKPNEPITKVIKNRFERQRKIAKVVHLALSYLGTEYTVSKNLCKEGIPTTNEEAKRYVQAYWRKFSKVKSFYYQLRELNRAQGYLRNVIGRIIRVPNPEYKDLANRFVQSSAHDCLVLWVLEIYKLSEERDIKIKPVVLDIHDSTSNSCPESQAEALEQIYVDALTNVNKKLELVVPIKAEMKRYKTLAGLKTDEN